MPSGDLCSWIVPQEEADFSIVDIAPTLLRYLEKKGSFRRGRIDSGVLGEDIKFYSLYDIQRSPYYCGASLEDVIENRLNVDLESFDRIIVFLIDGLNLLSMIGITTEFLDNINYEFLSPMSTTFPSMTTVATTSLLTGSYPIAHGVVADNFYSFEEDKKYTVKPYLTENTKLRLPRMIPITTYFLLADFWEQHECSLGFITLGKAHDKINDRRFIDYFFGEEFKLGGDFINTNSNHLVYCESKKWIQKNKNKKFNLLFVRFSIDRYSHAYGPTSQKTKDQLKTILHYIVDLNNELKKDPAKKTLIFMLSDHGHKELNEGFVPLSSLRKYLMPGYKHMATNQTILSLYHDDLHIDNPEFSNVINLIRLKKQKSKFYFFDINTEKWTHLNKNIEKINPIMLDSEKFGVDNRIGDLVIHAENFYFGYRDASDYSRNFTSFKSSHGGLSISETMCMAFFWTTK